jgi:hypothetical protein
MSFAESCFGQRDMTYELRPPAFAPDGPYIMVWHEPKAVGAILSPNAANSWDVAIFELAHECVHMLNPVTGYTNHLEEGIATDFQLLITPVLTARVVTANMEKYLHARSLVEELGTDVIQIGRQIREQFGAFKAISSDDVAKLWPGHRIELYESLASTCQPRIVDGGLKVVITKSTEEF